MAQRRRRIRCPSCQSLQTVRYGSFSLRRKMRKGKRERRKRWYCNDCQRAFTPYQAPSEYMSLRAYRAVDLYFDSRASYRDVARKLGISRQRVWQIAKKYGLYFAPVFGPVDAAQKWNCSESTVREFIKRGVIPAERKRGHWNILTKENPRVCRVTESNVQIRCDLPYIDPSNQILQ